MHDIDRLGVLFRNTPKANAVPLVLDSPHSGTDYPEDFNHISDFDVLRRAEDTYIHELYANAPRMGATLIGAHFPRSYVDVNRGLDEIDTSILDGKWTGPISDSEKAEAGIGLIWRVNQLNENIYDRKLSIEEAQARIDSYWQPYHDTLKSTLDEIYEKFGKVVHLNCHSMPEISNESSKEGPGVQRPQFCLGDRFGTTCDPEIVQLTKSTLEGLGYQVSVNEPYAGVELVRAYSDMKNNRNSLQIEIRRDLYMNEKTLEKSSNFNTLKDDLDVLVKTLSELCHS